jgi:hypothetical protein
MTGHATHTRAATRCGMCKRRMLPDWLAYRSIPTWLYDLLRLEGRVNCGGDCLRCVEGSTKC